MSEPYDPTKELEAMGLVATATKGLPAEATRRVLDWARQTLLGEPSLGVSKHSRGAASADAALGSETIESPILAEFFARASTSSGPERALVVAYWFQVQQEQEDFDGKTINDALKEMGHGLPNVTATMNLLMSQKPQPVIQMKKQGKTRQARKLYRLTAEGQRRVQEMLRRIPE